MTDKHNPSQALDARHRFSAWERCCLVPAAVVVIDWCGMSGCVACHAKRNLSPPDFTRCVSGGPITAPELDRFEENRENDTARITDL